MTTMTTATDVIAARERARAAGLPARAGGVRVAARAAACSTRDGRALSRPDLRRRRRRRSATRTRARARRSPTRRASCCTRRTCSSIRCRASWPRGSPTLSGLPRAFFCNSGAEAVEACLKFARRYWHAQGTPRTGFVALRPLVPRPDDGRAVGDVGRALPRTRSRRWCRASRSSPPTIATALHGGGHDSTRPRSSSSRSRAKAACGRSRRPMADAITDACRETGALLIADEVQCGLGRTGRAVLLAASRPAAGPDGARQGARRRRSDRRGAVHASASPRRRRPAITAAPTAATCSPAARRWCSSTS